MSAVHWNGNIVCAVDIETSGTDPAKHDILSIAVLPLAPDLTPSKRHLFFDMELMPLKKYEDVDPRAMRTNQLDWHHLRENGLDPYKIAELFEEWFLRLKLPEKKSIIPLAHNWPFEKSFLTEWLGPISMDHYFFQYRDSLALANSINDMAEMQSQQIPFPKTSLKYLCSEMKIENERAHTALSDCRACAEVYRRLITRYKVYT